MSKKRNRVTSDAAVMMLVALAVLYLCGMSTSRFENMPFLGMLGVALVISVIYSVVQLLRSIPAQQNGSDQA